MCITTASEQGRPGPLRRFKGAVRTLLTQGLSRRRLALTLALGVTLGVLPTLWGSTLACAAIAAALGLNQFAIQFANYLTYPLQILLFVPFLRFGQQLFGNSEIPIAFDVLVTSFHQDPGATLQDLGAANLMAIGAWALVSPPMLFVLYLLFAGILRWTGKCPS
jgi:hypothetical protein